MMQQRFVVRGQVLTADELLAQVPLYDLTTAPVRAQKTGHFGWRVVGIPPQTEAMPKGPVRRRALRRQPYCVYEAAIECAQLAEADGWTFVDVLEIVREGE